MNRWRYGLLVALFVGGIATAIAILAGGETTKQASLPFGALGPPPPPGNLCTPAQDGQAFDGTNALQNRSDDEIAIERVRLLKPIGMRIVDAYLTPIFDQTLIGNVPPKDGVHGNKAWKERVPAVGARIASHETRNLVLVLDMTRDEPSSSEQIEVLYRDAAGRKYHFLSGTKLQLAASPTC